MESPLLQGSRETLINFPRVSVAIPLYNEASNVDELLARTLRVLDELPGGPHELLLVDDGSADETLSLLEKAASRDPRIVILSLSRNFGHQAALGAALDHVSGDAVVFMDGDLQDTPAALPQFVHKFRQGYDVVYAVRASRREGRLLRACYTGFYWLIDKLTNMPLPRDAGDFGLMSRRVVEFLRNCPERHRYWRGLRTWVGFRQIGIPVDRDPRHSGTSKYSAWKLFGLALDGICSFSTVPLRAAAVVGMFTVLISLCFVAFAIYVKVATGQTPQGFTSLIGAITLLAGVQLVFLGIIGEYIGRIYEHVKLRPHYILDKITRHTWTENTQSVIENSTNDIGGGVPGNDLSSPTSGGTSQDPGE